MGRKGVYLYCFARAGRASANDARGIDEQEPVKAITADSVAAVVSQVRLDRFGEECTKDPSWVIPRACRHERVVEEVMARSPVLPVRFGAVFSSEQALAGLLTKRAHDISRFLDSVSEKDEWSVKAFASVKRSEGWLLSSDPGLAGKQRQLPESPGARYLCEKRLRADVKERAAAWRRALPDRIEDELKRYAADICHLKLQTRSPAGTDAQMVFNCAVLLPRDRVAGLRRLVDKLSDAYLEQGLSLEVSGPWPPYNFVPSEVLEEAPQ